MKNLEEIINYSMSFITDDFTELWIVANKIKDENPEFSFTELIDATKVVLKELVENHGVCLLDENSKRPLILPPTVIVDMVDFHMRIIGKIPNIGDGIWLTICNGTNIIR